MHKILKWATEEVDNPDLRDRGFMYWRMLALNPALAGEIVLSEKPPITTDSDRMDRGALDQLLLHTGTLGSIYHKNPEVRKLHPFVSVGTHSLARRSSVTRPEEPLLTALLSTPIQEQYSSTSRGHNYLTDPSISPDVDLSNRISLVRLPLKPLLARRHSL